MGETIFCQTLLTSELPDKNKNKNMKQKQKQTTKKNMFFEKLRMRYEKG
jgi:hypothetical protein